MSSRSRSPPKVITTGLGYQYVRCQANGEDHTVYIHQLCAIAGGADPHDVFSDVYDTHHLLSIPTQWGLPQIDTPENCELVPRWEHRTKEVNGETVGCGDIPFDIGSSITEETNCPQ